MKIFVNLVALVFVSMRPGFAEDISYTKAIDTLGLSQQPIALKLDKSSSGIQFSEATATGCSQSIDTFKNGKLIGWAENNQNISKFFTCADPRNLNLLRFSTSSCQEAISCRKNVSQMQVNSAGADKLMNEIVAKDYAKNVLDQNSEAMDRLEILKQFAQKKYDLKGEKCNSRFQPKKGGVCNLSLLDEVFVDQQANCKFGNGCFNKTEANVMNFSSYKEQEKVAKTAFVVEYNEYRIKEKVKKSVDVDADYVNELADLVTSEDFKKATAEQKGDMFLAKMDSGSRDRYKDPVLAYDFDSVSEKAKLKKMLKFRQLASIYDNKDLTKDSFISGFNTYRKNRAEAVLENSGSCNETTDIKKICEDMTTLSLGKTLSKDSLSVEHLSSRDLKNEKDFEKFKSYMGETFNERDYDTLVNAKRCLSFGLASEEYNDMASDKGHRPSGFGSVVGAMAGPSESAVDSSREKISSYMGDTSVVKSEAPKGLEPKMGDSSEAESDTNINNALAAGAQAAASANFANPFNQGFTPGAYGVDDEAKNEKNEKKDEVAATAPAAATTTTNDSKMSDLMKRLASAEDKVDKMKAASEEAENNRIKQKKLDEENALIKDLKGQISDLKAAKDKKESTAPAVAVAAPVVEQPKSQTGNVYASSYNSGPSNTPARQDSAPKAADNYDINRGSNNASSSISSSGRSGMNSAILSSTNSAENKVLPSGVSITTVDGMTTEKATQTISNKILELNGIPFYIEEGGMVKEIIAVVKDGKVLLDEKGNPIFEKIVKGKVGDKKFAKVKDNKGRAPAAITDAADLKRDQEEKLKRERAEYLKLKNLTNEVLKKK